MDLRQLIEILSGIVIIAGLPLAIFTFFYETRKERQSAEDEVQLMLSAGYTDFLKLTLQHPDLKLQSRYATPGLDADQRERMQTLFAILVSLFERAYLFAYDARMSAAHRRRWASWEDFMREWCRREDFRQALPRLLPGEDPDFAAYLTRIAEQEAEGDDPVLEEPPGWSIPRSARQPS